MIKKVGMIVRFNVINYLIGEGVRNLFKNKKSTMSSLMIMCATMLVFGLFFVIGENIMSPLILTRGINSNLVSLVLLLPIGR